MRNDTRGRLASAGCFAALVAVLTGVLTEPGVSSRAIAQMCVFTKGYWRMHTNAWPATALTLGNVTYSQSDLIKILDLNAKKDASLTLADQLIATKLNIASGSNPAPIAATVSRADSLLAAFPGKLPYNVPP